MAYLASSGLCIAAIGCLSQQSTARIGNALGIVGVSGGIAATLGSITASPAVVAQILGKCCVTSTVIFWRGYFSDEGKSFTCSSRSWNESIPKSVFPSSFHLTKKRNPSVDQ